LETRVGLRFQTGFMSPLPTASGNAGKPVFSKNSIFFAKKYFFYVLDRFDALSQK
jgi:hypothetical protein